LLADIALRIVSQPILWIVFIFIAAIILVKSLFRPKKSQKIPYRSVTRYPGKAEELTRLIHFARESDYSRWKLAHYLAELTSEILSFRRQCPPEQIREQLQNGTLDIDPEVQVYLQAGIGKKILRQTGFFARIRQRFQPRDSPSSFDIDPEIAVRFLEHQLYEKKGNSS
jgi:hypothetical protein